MITYYIGGEGSAETPKNDYVIYGWPLNDDAMNEDVADIDAVWLLMISWTLCPTQHKTKKKKLKFKQKWLFAAF